MKGGSRGGRLHALDGLRALAVTLVFAHHISQKSLPGGFIGVDAFFVLSGYLITFLLLSEHHRYGNIDLRRFYLRRALRLYPALIAVVIVVGSVSTADGIRWAPLDGFFALIYMTDFWGNVAPHLNLLAHTWSLSVEEQFYLVWPAILLYALRKGWRIEAMIWALIAVSVALTCGIHLADVHRFRTIQYLPFSHIAELGSGILLALQAQRGFHPIMRSLGHPIAATVALFLLFAAEFLLKPHWWAFPFDTVICWPIVASLVIYPSSRIARGFSWRPFVWLGERSYGFYLWHYPIVIFMVIHGVSTGVRIAGGLAVTLAFTMTSWTFIEQPFLRKKARLERVPDSAVAETAFSADVS